MTTTQHPDRVVLHIAGNDRPGVTARLAEVIAEDESAQLINIGQSVLHGYLMLSAIVDIPRNSYALRKLLFRQLADDLLLHTTSRDKGFYPRIKGLDTSVKAAGDHLSLHVLRRHIDAILASFGDDDAWTVHFETLRLDVLRHFDHEEHQIFDLARHHLSHAEAVELAATLESLIAARGTKAAA